MLFHFEPTTLLYCEWFPPAVSPVTDHPPAVFPLVTHHLSWMTPLLIRKSWWVSFIGHVSLSINDFQTDQWFLLPLVQISILNHSLFQIYVKLWMNERRAFRNKSLWEAGRKEKERQGLSQLSAAITKTDLYFYCFVVVCFGDRVSLCSQGLPVLNFWAPSVSMYWPLCLSSFIFLSCWNLDS